MEAGTVEHLKGHIEWPATGQVIIDACNNMSDVNDMDKKIIEEHVDPTMTYASPDELMVAVEKNK